MATGRLMSVVFLILSSKPKFVRGISGSIYSYIKIALHKREGHFKVLLKNRYYAPNWNLVNDFTLRSALTLFK